MCPACPHDRAATLSPWASHCMLLRQLIEAGCQFGPDDLTLAEWLGVAELTTALQADALEASKARQGSAPPPPEYTITR